MRPVSGPFTSFHSPIWFCLESPHIAERDSIIQSMGESGNDEISADLIKHPQ